MTAFLAILAVIVIALFVYLITAMLKPEIFP